MAFSSSSDSLTFSPATSSTDEVAFANDQSVFATNYVLDTSASLVGPGHNNLEPKQSYGSGSNNVLLIGSAEAPTYGSGPDNVLYIGSGEGSTNDFFMGSVDGSFNGSGSNNGVFIGSTDGLIYGSGSNNGLFIGSGDGSANGSNNGFANPNVPLVDPAPLREVGPDNLAPQAAPRPRQRGRPFGSKNKPKPEVINVDHGFVPKSLVMEVPSGVDIVQAIRDFTATHRVGVTILSGAGWVQNVTVQNAGLHEPNTARIGVHKLIMMDGLYVGPAQLNPPINPSVRMPGGPHNYINVLLNGPSVGLWGGHIVGPFIAAGPVTIHMTTFKRYEYHRLAPDQTNVASSSGAGSSRGGPNPYPGSAWGNGPYMGGGPSQDPNYMGRKRNRFSGN